MKAIVTGSAAGIGRAVANRLAEDCRNDGGVAHLLLVDRDADGLRSIADELRARGAVIATAVADLADPESPARAVAQAETELGGLDVLVSNAGIMIPGKLVDMSAEDYHRVFAVNTHATWLFAKAAYPLLKQSRGSFITISSLASEVVTPLRGPYSATKAAVVMFMRQLAYEWGEDGIRCNAISPGGIDTPLNSSTFQDPVQAKLRMRRVPLRRLGQAEEIASAVSFLASDDASYITGINMVVDGGMQVGMMAAFREAPANKPGDG